MALRAHIQPVQLIPVLKRNRAAVPEKSYRNPEIDENLQVRLASYLGLSYRMFLIGTQAAKGGPRDEKKCLTLPTVKEISLSSYM